MNRTIITTVGTSLLSNYYEKNVKPSGFNALGNYPFYFEKLLEEYKMDSFIKICKEVSSHTYKYLEGNPKNACAEISSIFAIEKELKKDLKENEELHLTIHFLCTDTILSPLCAEVIAKYFEKDENKEVKEGDKIIIKRSIIFENIEKDETIISKIKEQGFISNYIVKDLNLKSYSEQGLLNLIEQIKETTNKIGIENTLLNITGGYKALIPPITILAQLYHLSIYYLYEDSSDVIHLPPMPVGFDWEVIEKYITLLFSDNKRINPKWQQDVLEMQDLNLVFKNNTNLTPLGIILREYLKDKESPLTGTIMGYFVEHKLYKYYQTKFDCSKVKHSVKSTDGGDVDLVIDPDKNSKIGIEVKPVSVLENPFNSWEQLLDKFPKRVLSLENVGEVWLILYGENESSINKDTVRELKEKIDANISFKCKFLKIQKSKQSQERHIYQDFFKSDIKDNQVIDIVLTP